MRFALWALVNLGIHLRQQLGILIFRWDLLGAIWRPLIGKMGWLPSWERSHILSKLGFWRWFSELHKVGYVSSLEGNNPWVNPLVLREMVVKKAVNRGIFSETNSSKTWALGGNWRGVSNLGRLGGRCNVSLREKIWYLYIYIFDCERKNIYIYIFTYCIKKT